MPRSLKLYITLLVALSAVALAVTSFAFGVRPAIAIEVDGLPGASNLEIALGLAFWAIVTAIASALPVRMPRGMLVTVSIAPVIAATTLGGPAAGAWIALVGSTEDENSEAACLGMERWRITPGSSCLRRSEAW